MIVVVPCIPDFRDILSAVDLPLPRLGRPRRGFHSFGFEFYFLSIDCIYHTCRILYIADGHGGCRIFSAVVVRRQGPCSSFCIHSVFREQPMKFLLWRFTLDYNINYTCQIGRAHV